MAQKYVLGLDTSNYKTSAAVVCGNIAVIDLRQFLKVREGERGIRQSEALFQHVQNLPEILGQLREKFDGSIGAVAYSTRPRAVRGSYMPCFTAGMSQAVSIASALDVPAVGFSHQEGHIEAVVSSLEKRPEGDFIACHFSGGTCEVLLVRNKTHVPENTATFKNYNGENSFYDIEIIGGTKDISYGQVLDRAGVEMGIPFPCGQVLDEMALSAESGTDILTSVKVKERCVHLSGFDTQIRNKLAEAGKEGINNEQIIREAFEKMSDSIVKMLLQSAEMTGLRDVYMSGGVSSSRFIRSTITERLNKKGIGIHFAPGDMSSDNAVGTAFLGRRFLWD